MDLSIRSLTDLELLVELGRSCRTSTRTLPPGRVPQARRLRKAGLLAGGESIEECGWYLTPLGARVLTLMQREIASLTERAKLQLVE